MLNCPICTFESKHVFDTKYVKVAQCSNLNCKHLFAFDISPNQGECELNQKVDKFSIYKERNNALVKYWVRNGFIKQGMKILDFGSGDGHILRTIVEKFPDIEITCIESAESYRSFLSTHGFNVIDSFQNLSPKEKFDSVLCIEVIEHLDNPLEIIIEIKKRIKSNGKIFITTPAGELRKGQFDSKQLNAYNTPTHVQFFTEKSLNLCLKKAGFKNLRYKFLNELYPNRDYTSFKSRVNTIKNYYYYLRGYTQHLTYFAS